MKLINLLLLAALKTGAMNQAQLYQDPTNLPCDLEVLECNKNTIAALSKLIAINKQIELNSFTNWEQIMNNFIAFSEEFFPLDVKDIMNYREGIEILQECWGDLKSNYKDEYWVRNKDEILRHIYFVCEAINVLLGNVFCVSMNSELVTEFSRVIKKESRVYEIYRYFAKVVVNPILERINQACNRNLFEDVSDNVRCVKFFIPIDFNTQGLSQDQIEDLAILEKTCRFKQVTAKDGTIEKNMCLAIYFFKTEDGNTKDKIWLPCSQQNHSDHKGHIYTRLSFYDRALAFQPFEDEEDFRKIENRAGIFMNVNQTQTSQEKVLTHTFNIYSGKNFASPYKYKHMEVVENEIISEIANSFKDKAVYEKFYAQFSTAEKGEFIPFSEVQLMEDMWCLIFESILTNILPKVSDENTQKQFADFYDFINFFVELYSNAKEKEKEMLEKKQKAEAKKNAELKKEAKKQKDQQKKQKKLLVVKTEVAVVDEEKEDVAQKDVELIPEATEVIEMLDKQEDEVDELVVEEVEAAQAIEESANILQNHPEIKNDLLEKILGTFEDVKLLHHREALEKLIDKWFKISKIDPQSMKLFVKGSHRNYHGPGGVCVIPVPHGKSVHKSTLVGYAENFVQAVSVKPEENLEKKAAKNIKKPGANAQQKKLSVVRVKKK